MADLLIDPAGFNLKQIPGRSYEIFDPQFTEEKRQLAILLQVDTDVIYPHLLTVRKDAYDVIGEEYIFIRPYRGRSYSRRQINRMDPERDIGTLCFAPRMHSLNWRPTSKQRKQNAKHLFLKCIIGEMGRPELTCQN